MRGDVEALIGRLQATRPHPLARQVSFLVVLVVVTALLCLSVVGSKWGLPASVGILLPWGLMALLGVIGWLVGRRQRRFRGDLRRAAEAVQQQDWPAAADLLDRLTARPIRAEADRAAVYLLAGTLAEHERRYEAAGALYTALLSEDIADPMQLHHAGLALAEVKLRTGELTDGVALLGRIERSEVPPPLRAACDLVRLFQQVMMGHVEDAVARITERVALFRRHLSTQAGYAYALLAAALHASGRTEEAARYWRDATALVPAERLVGEYELLQPLPATYPSTEHPI